MTAKYMNSYLKQEHTKEVEKVGVNSYKVLLNINDSAWNINKHCAYILKNRLSLSCSKLRAKLRKLKILPHVSAVSMSLCL
jgi:hypothetical protein